MTTTSEIAHPGVKDKWEAKIASARLDEQLRILEDIKDQRDRTDDQIKALTEKKFMHERDLAYVAQLIASHLPASVIQAARHESQEGGQTK